MKYNPLSGTGIELRLFEKDFFNTHIKKKGDEYFFNERKIAERKTLSLTQDEVYKTQFYNEQLSRALPQTTQETLWVFKNKLGNVIQNISNLPSLKNEIASFVFEVEPKDVPTQVSVIIYEGPTVHDILLTDGSVKMDPNYYPEENQDVITKIYLESYLNNWAAERDGISTFKIKKATGEPLDKGFRFTDNVYLPVIYVQKYYAGKGEDLSLKIEPFSIPPTWVNPKISVMFNNMSYYGTPIERILKGQDDLWTLDSSKNIYTEEVSELYWRNGYTLHFNPSLHTELISFDKTSSKDITVDVKIRIWDDTRKVKYSEDQTYGIDYWVWKVESKNTLQYVTEDLQKDKTVWVSGISYYPNTDKDFNINVQAALKNNFLTYYRPDIVARLYGIYAQQKDPLLLHEFSLETHTPLWNKETYNFSINLNYKIGLTKLKLVTYNLKGVALNETYIDFDTDTDCSDESNRVSTPDGTEQYPVEKYGAPWDSTAPLRDWDMFLRNGVYTYPGEDVEKSAVCFKINPEDCYSHLITNIEHDGDMYIKVQGNTGWLDCKRHKDAILNPVWSGDGCLVNDEFYSFGKVVYKEPVFIRIIHAKKVIFKSAELN